MDILINGVIYALLSVALLLNFFQMWHKVPKNFIFLRLIQGLWCVLCAFFLLKGYILGWFTGKYNQPMSIMETTTNILTLINAVFSILLVRYFMRKGKA